MANISGASVLGNLKQKMQSLRDELDKYKDLHDEKCHELERERSVKYEIENEAQALNRRVHLLEDERDQLDARLHEVVAKLQEASKVVDEHERARRSLENKQNLDGDRMSQLEEHLHLAKISANESERKYEEVQRKLRMTEVELERAEERSEAAEGKVRQLDTELHHVTGILKSLEISGNSLAQREEHYETTIADLNVRLRNAEQMAEMMSRELKTKENELIHTEENFQVLEHQYRQLRAEMDSCFQDLNSL